MEESQESTAAAETPPDTLEQVQAELPPLGPLYLSLAVVAMANTILASALPAVSSDLAGARDYTAIVTAYLLPKALATPVGGRLVDAWRPKRVVAGFSWLYILTTGLCGLVTSIDQLLLLRVFQGLTGGGLLASVYVMIDLMVPPRFQGRVQGRVSLVLGSSAAAAPLIGGLITEYLGWRWCFFLNLPPLIFSALALRSLPDLSPKGKLSVDWRGLISLVLVSSPLLLAATWGGVRYPWSSPQILSLLGLCAIGSLLFWWVERIPEEPLFDPEMAADPVIRWSFVACFCTGGAFLGSLLFLPQFMVTVVGVGPALAGLALVPYVVGSMVGSVYGGGRVEDTGRYRKALVVSNLGTIVVSLLLWWMVDSHLWLTPFFLLQFLLAFFLGWSQGIYGIAVQNATAAERQGMTGSGLEFVRILGSALGLSLVGSMFLLSLDETMPSKIKQWLEPLGIEVRLESFESPDKVKELQTELHRHLLQVEGKEESYQRLAHLTGMKTTPKGGVDEVERRAMDSLIEAASHAIRKAQGHVYLLTALLSVIGLFASVMQPERKLRTTLEAGPEAPTP